MFNAKELRGENMQSRPDGRWELAKPYPDFRWLVRLSQAWRVLTGRAEIVVWDDQ